MWVRYSGVKELLAQLEYRPEAIAEFFHLKVFPAVRLVLDREGKDRVVVAPFRAGAPLLEAGSGRIVGVVAERAYQPSPTLIDPQLWAAVLLLLDGADQRLWQEVAQPERRSGRLN